MFFQLSACAWMNERHRQRATKWRRTTEYLSGLHDLILRALRVIKCKGLATKMRA
jgi:hypothetical protein